MTAIWSELGVDSDAGAIDFENIGELLAQLDESQAFSAY